MIKTVDFHLTTGEVATQGSAAPVGNEFYQGFISIPISIIVGLMIKSVHLTTNLYPTKCSNPRPGSQQCPGNTERHTGTIPYSRGYITYSAWHAAHGH